MPEKKDERPILTITLGSKRKVKIRHPRDREWAGFFRLMREKGVPMTTEPTPEVGWIIAENFPAVKKLLFEKNMIEPPSIEALLFGEKLDLVYRLQERCFPGARIPRRTR